MPTKKHKIVRLRLGQVVYRSLFIAGASLTVFLSGCGGGGGGASGGVLAPSASLANLCVSPRANTSDKQGTLEQEKSYLRSFVDETYLWYRDVPSNLVASNYATPQTYFDALKTPAKTVSGNLVDQFHWSQTTASWDAAASGISEDYGIQWAAKASSPPRNWLVVDVAPSSPAAIAGVKRGD